MNNEHENAVTKVHPATREILPEDPMDLHGIEVPGDTESMLRMLVEEYARMGWDLDAIMHLARDPYYQGFHGLLGVYGEEDLQRRVSQILGRCGVTRVKTVEAQAAPEQLVELKLPTKP